MTTNSRVPGRAFVRIIYTNLDVEEKEIDIEEAMRLVDDSYENSRVNTGRCSKRIGHFIMLFHRLAESFINDEKKLVGTPSFTIFRRWINEAIKGIASSESVTPATITDQFCRQCSLSKDGLLQIIVNTFETARTKGPEAAISSADGIYCYLVDHDCFSSKVAGFDEKTFLKERLLEIFKSVHNA